MVQFRLLNKTRQETDYSCGASALRTVLSYWGKDVDETELMKRLHTTSEVGTFPEHMVRVARELGFDAEAKENLTLDEVQQFTGQGHPMIGLGQVWRSQRDTPGSVADEWDAGHYFVVLAVDKDYVYFQDPFVRMSKGFAPRKEFEDHWHQAMGGDLRTQPKLTHLGIFVRGQRPAARKAAEALNYSDLDFEKFGSFNLMVTQFRGTLLPFDLFEGLRDIWDRGDVRPDAFIFLRKNKEGKLTAIEGSQLRDEADMAEVNALIAAITSRSVGRPESARSAMESAIQASAEGDFGLSTANIQEIARKLPPDHSAIIALFENVWERKFKEAAKKFGGDVINQRLISPSALAKLAGALT